MLNIVLVEPEIPQNTGNIARTCAATGCALHLVKPLGFSLDDKYMKRAGLDYWFLAEIHVHESWQDFCRAYPQARMFFATTKAKKSYAQAEFCEGDFLVFGRETRGLPESLLAEHQEACIRIPMRRKRAASTFPIPSPLWRMKRCGSWGFPGLAGESDYTLPEWRDYV